ncbi:ATP-binding protein, partial [Cetobacterium somerae]|nr:ATP-binding protein [Cetobacterium somerae]
ISKEEANLFFQLISKLDEKVAMVITSNKTFSEWTEFLGDPALV